MKKVEPAKECRAIVSDIGEGKVELEMGGGAVQVCDQMDLPDVQLGQVLILRVIHGVIVSYQIDEEETKRQRRNSREITKKLLEM